MKKKLVPDPPLETCTTAPAIFGSCEAGHAPLYSVNPGIAAHDALVHISLHLRCAYDSGHHLMEQADPGSKRMLWTTLHSVDAAKGLVDALLDGIEARALSNATAT
ncbi:hypothetical protein DCO48_19720 [Pseudomonas sp. SDI]|uniref:DUF3077 domain-containing protein n=1 Tax=Pseudomonas sp. SDI TaxID=2170734 RepID=UPI000DE7354A|nr:DUF3077 domain-containing protein [Pseudomonas sp. SDI]PWB30672.1 hypothetical protein DCO48_19720 [Pseudomonas sp. SDI]